MGVWGLLKRKEIVYVLERGANFPTNGGFFKLKHVKIM